MNREEIRNILIKNGVILEGHFLLRSGKHSHIYFEKYRLIEKPHLLSMLVKSLIKKYIPDDFDVVVGPVTGGAIIAFEFARQTDRRFLIAEKQNYGFVIERGSGISRGERVIVVEDVVTTGGSVRKVIEEVKRKGGNVLAVYSLIDRGESGEWNLPYFTLYTEKVESFYPEECPLCKQGIPLNVKGGRENILTK